MSQTNNLICVQLDRLSKVFSKDKLQSCRQNLSYFCIYMAVLSTISSYPVCANPISSTASTIRVSDLPFSEKLSNPCSLMVSSSLRRSTLADDTPDTRRNVFNQMKAKASLLKASAETILRTNVLNVCSTLVIPTVATIPSVDDISNSTPLEVLRSFYTSLLNHTAHVFFISEQIQVYSDSQCHDPGLDDNSKSLGSEMQSLMCALRYTTLTLQCDSDEDDSFDDSTDQILNEEFSDHSDCSRRAFRDCQTIRSTVDLLRELNNYLQNTVLDSSGC